MFFYVCPYFFPFWLTSVCFRKKCKMCFRGYFNLITIHKFFSVIIKVAITAKLTTATAAGCIISCESPPVHQKTATVHFSYEYTLDSWLHIFLSWFLFFLFHCFFLRLSDFSLPVRKKTNREAVHGAVFLYTFARVGSGTSSSQHEQRRLSPHLHHPPPALPPPPVPLPAASARKPINGRAFRAGGGPGARRGDQ